MTYHINQKKCISCGTCHVECRFDALDISSEGKFSINPEKFRRCGVCVTVCPVDAVFVAKECKMS